jgi:hypothetical protein
MLQYDANVIIEYVHFEKNRLQFNHNHKVTQRISQRHSKEQIKFNLMQFDSQYPFKGLY